MAAMASKPPPGRSSKKLEPHQEWITERHQAKATVDEIMVELMIKHHLKIGRSTLKKQIARWGLRVRRAKWEDSQALRRHVKHCFDRLQLTDEAARLDLQKHGYDIAPTRLAKLRKEMGMYKRTEKEQRPLQEGQVEEILKKEFEDPRVRDMSLKKLHKYLHAKHNIWGRDRLYHIAKKLDPEGPARRLKIQMKETRAKQRTAELRRQQGGQEEEDEEELPREPDVSPQQPAQPAQPGPTYPLTSDAANYDPALIYSQPYGYHQAFS
ncbi:uncharacterized protein MYCFIDRAFT_216252 [Pseudocercospora fijiensis CIRAD86]|uniref:Clr5 domain-containing protein n=1 Tax=Pseudocercospora fijiensis (strain CIRAD86) TaxID=383855 RepID=M3ATN0_PSEFD|nr:uncharacterized protein MYCFIDRAFT_216252 [Pseudocercospora fijiensis CIRAD86]EME80518.1 hypothetical protein MYCFIDRAFT_216252 [Pseudocercospora fijiensis CIRAD86]